MVKAARGDATQSDGTSDGKTSAVRDVVQANQRLTDTVDDWVGVSGQGIRMRWRRGQVSGQIQGRSGCFWPNKAVLP